MLISFSAKAWADYIDIMSVDRTLLKRINLIIKDIQRDPFNGIGKPEPLKHNLSGYWSRRLTDEHRLVYTMEDDTLVIIQCRHHY
jgi:toxin YoeB